MDIYQRFNTYQYRVLLDYFKLRNPCIYSIIFPRVDLSSYIYKIIFILLFLTINLSLIFLNLDILFLNYFPFSELSFIVKTPLFQEKANLAHIDSVYNSTAKTPSPQEEKYHPHIYSGSLNLLLQKLLLSRRKAYTRLIRINLFTASHFQ